VFNKDTKKKVLTKSSQSTFTLHKRIGIYSSYSYYSRCFSFLTIAQHLSFSLCQPYASFEDSRFLSGNICFEFSVQCLCSTTAVRKGCRPEINSSIVGQFMEALRTSRSSLEVLKALRSEGANYTYNVAYESTRTFVNI
jgi:hypothetical protein